MTFDSYTFLFFFLIFFTVYYSIAEINLRLQNFVIMVGSFVFYGWWDHTFLYLMLVSCLTDYYAGIILTKYDDEGILRNRRIRKATLLFSLSVNLGILFTFKYFDFFAESFLALLENLNLDVSISTIKLVLPVGISFYTFQSMGYTIDVYKRHLTAEKNIVTFLAFTTFFPHLVAGPMMRGMDLLPQFYKTRRLTLENTKIALWLILWGYFLKTVIADNAAQYVNIIFKDNQTDGTLTVLGTIAFGLQIYCDFCGYALIAKGTAKLLGFDLIWNFNHPYFASSIRDFWRRWHIALSTWLRDYLYISLGGSRKGQVRTYLNLFITMLLGGLWHGASWNFVLWGALHGGALTVNHLFDNFVKLPFKIPKSISWALTMLVVFFGWLLFRAKNMTQLSSMVSSLGSFSWDWRHQNLLIYIVIMAAPVLLVDYWQYHSKDLLVAVRIKPQYYFAINTVLLTLVFIMFQRISSEFIYFQF